MSFTPQPPMAVRPMMTQGYTFTPMGMMPITGVIPPTAVTPPVPKLPITIELETVKASESVTSVTLAPIQMIPAPTVSILNRHPLFAKQPVVDPKDKPPVTTVFVGNISERAPDAMVRLMLQRCGNVLSWKRVQGASGKLQAFGFCEYEKPESTLRCIRLLNEWQIADKKLVVKVDAKTKTLLDEYLRKTKEAEKGEKGDAEEEGECDDSEEQEKSSAAAEAQRKDDNIVKAGLDRIIVENAVILAKVPPPSEEKAPQPQTNVRPTNRRTDINDGSMDQMEMEEDRKQAISSEILSFRKLHKEEPKKPSHERSERELLANEERRIREFQRKQDRELFRARLRVAKSRSRSKSPDKPTKSTERSERSEKSDRSERSERTDRSDRSNRLERADRLERTDRSERRRSRSASREKSAVRDRERRDRERAVELEEEDRERRKLEKKLREKEAAYRERLKLWESRESKKHREYRKEKEREEGKNIEEEKEARRLKEFLEDYDDERDDVKYYKGSGLQRRMKEREKEVETDDRDRAREKEELEEIKRRLHDEGHPDVEAEIFKLERQRNEHLRPKPIQPEQMEPPRHSRRQRPKSPTPEADPNPPPSLEPVDMNHRYQEQEEHEEPDESEQLPAVTNQKLTIVDNVFTESPAEPDQLNQPEQPVQTSRREPSSSPDSPPQTMSPQQTTFKPIPQVTNEKSESPSTEAAKRKKLTVVDVFNQDEDDENGPKKRKLVPLDYTEEEAREAKKPKTIEEKRAHIKTLIERIPTGKEELFDFPLDWNIVDSNLMDKRIKPWVNKKIVEYIGEEEPTLTEFICQKVIAKSSPQNILNDVAMVLDEEAEVFIVKMWRLLIYETEAKKAGLVK